MNVAKTITFHDRIRKKCVTLDGDITDPSGTLSGGAPQKGGSVLLQLAEIQDLEVYYKLIETLIKITNFLSVLILISNCKNRIASF